MTSDEIAALRRKMAEASVLDGTKLLLDPNDSRVRALVDAVLTALPALCDAAEECERLREAQHAAEADVVGAALTDLPPAMTAFSVVIETGAVATDIASATLRATAAEAAQRALADHAEHERAERDAATARAERAEKECERLRAENGAKSDGMLWALSGRDIAIADRDAATARTDAAERRVRELEGALGEAIGWLDTNRVPRSTVDSLRAVLRNGSGA